LCGSQTDVWKKESLKRLYSIRRGRLYHTRGIILVMNVSIIWNFHEFYLVDKAEKRVYLIDLKRITRCKLALIFTSADLRKFLGLFWF
jgi:hypothetical protein